MRHRLFVVSGIGLILVLAGVLVFGNLNENLVYYLTPSETLDRAAEFEDGRRFRLGGLVVPGSIEQTTDRVRFTVTDDVSTVAVVHRGAPPQLFQEGIGVVVEGVWSGGQVESDTLIIKHDEEYRSPDGEGPYLPPGPGDASP